MSHETSFDLARFKNRNGASSWRLSGWLHGVRIRKNFKSREEAAAEKAALEIAAAEATSGLRTVTTSLTTEQVREAEAVFHRIEGRALSLTGYVDFALANYRGPATNMPLAAAIDEYARRPSASSTSRPCSRNGNSEAIIRKHYLDLKSPAEAEQFFGILPKRAPAGTAPFTALPAPEIALGRTQPAA